MNTLMLNWRDDKTGVESGAIYEVHTPEVAAQIIRDSMTQNAGTYTLIGVQTA